MDLSTRAADAKLDALKARADKTVGASVAAGLAKPPAWLGPALAAVPGAVTILGTATGAAVALGSALATGGVALGTYGIVAKSVIGDAAKASAAVTAAQARYNIAIGTGTKASTAYAAEQKAILLAYHGMSPAQVELSRQIGAMSAAWSGVQKSVTPVIAMSVQPWIGGITSAMKLAKPVVTDVSQVVSSLGTSFDALVNLPSFATFAKFIGTEGSSAVNAGGGALLNFFQGFITLLPQFRPLIDEADQGITHLGTSFLTWAQSDAARRDIQQFLSWLHDNGPVVGHLLLAIGGALKTLGGGLLGGPAGAEEIRLLTGLFSLIAHLPPGFVQPVADLAASLLIISRFSWGKKIISIGVNWAGGGMAALLKLISGGKIDLAGKFSAAGGMQAAADTMLLASKGMQAAADTMAASGGMHPGGFSGGGVAGAEAKAAEANAAREAEAAAAGAGGTAAAARLGAGGILGGILKGVSGILKADPALWGLMLSGDTGATSRKFTRSELVQPGQTSAVRALTTFFGISEGDARKAVADVRAGQGTGNLNQSGIDPKTVAEIVMITAANAGLARATAQLNSAFAAGHGARTQFAGDLTAGSTDSARAKLLTDEYTLAVQRNGTTSVAAHQVRAQMVADFEHQGLSAQQANRLVDTYTAGVAKNGDTAAAKAAVRAQLIRDFEASGLSARQAAAQVDALIRKIAAVHSKSVFLDVKAAGTWSISSGGGGTPVGTPGGGHVRGPGQGARGGLIRGPGTGTSDTAGLFALSDKEFVQQRAAVDYYGLGFMHAVNERRFPKMAGGGLAGSFAGTASGLGSFDQREYAATQALIEAADAAAASKSLRSAVAAATARLMTGAAPGSSGIAVGAAQAWAKAHLAGYGWGPSQFPPLQALWSRESGWRYNALNPSSGAYGIPQALPGSKMASAGADWRTNPVTQMRWGLGYYIRPVYGSPAAAEAHEMAFGWYDRGGYMPPGLSLAYNGTGRPEHLTPSGPGDGPQDRGLAQLAGLLAEIADAVHRNAGDTGAAVALALGGTAQQASHRATYSARW